jgi:hypothetical protein
MLANIPFIESQRVGNDEILILKTPFLKLLYNYIGITKKKTPSFIKVYGSQGVELSR